MIQWLLVTLVKLSLAALEAAIGGGASSSSKIRQERSDDDFFNTSSTGSQGNIGKKKKDEAIIDEAYKFFELERAAATIEHVKKQYKKLSLRHHPDRNGGSQESQEAMQMVNACLQIIEKDLAGDDDDDNDNDEEGKNNEDHQRKTGKERYEEYEAMRRKMQEEMAKELKRHEERKKEFHRQKETENKTLLQKAKQQNLNSVQGRQAAHEQFQADKRKTEEAAAAATKQGASSQVPPRPEQGTMDDLDGDDDNENNNNNNRTNDSAMFPSTPSSSPLPGKPKNSVMDCNTEEVIVALRMGLPDVALEIWSGSYQSTVKNKMQNAYFTGETKVDMRTVTHEFLQQPYDDDGNTLLHYANYYESYQVCVKLCQTAQKAGCLEEILTKSNVHGDSPRVFAEIAQDDQSLLAFYEAQLELARIRKTQTHFIPAIRAAVYKVYEIVRNIDIGATTGTLVSFGFGHYLLKLHVVTTLAGMVLMKTSSTKEYGDGRDSCINESVGQVTVLVAFYLSWIVLRIAGQWLLQVIMIELVLILAPFVVAGLISKQRRRRGDGFGASLLGLILSPLAFLSFICRYMEPIYEAFANCMLTPNFLIDRGFLLPYLLSVTVLGLLGLGQVYEYVAGAS
jgi:curved DNA-binding protein CbpA